MAILMRIHSRINPGVLVGFTQDIQRNPCTLWSSNSLPWKMSFLIYMCKLSNIEHALFKDDLHVKHCHFPWHTVQSIFPSCRRSLCRSRRRKGNAWGGFSVSRWAFSLFQPGVTKETYVLNNGSVMEVGTRNLSPWVGSSKNLQKHVSENLQIMRFSDLQTWLAYQAQGSCKLSKNGLKAQCEGNVHAVWGNTQCPISFKQNLFGSH